MKNIQDITNKGYYTQEDVERESKKLAEWIDNYILEETYKIDKMDKLINRWFK